ncbi:MAG: DNA alkylation repair protein [Agromyces sp.]
MTTPSVAGRMTAARVHTAAAVMDALSELVTPGRADASAWFFKTGPGQYGEGDQFIGVSVPNQRRVARAFRRVPLAELDWLVDSEVHEHRLTGVLIAVDQYRAALKRGDNAQQETLVEWYLRAIARGRINNWDIVDSSAPQILGDWLFARPRDLLSQFAHSTDLWQRRIALLSTLGFIVRGDASSTLELIPLYLDSDQDLLHKAAGWMLREVGKRVSRELLRETLEALAGRMPRTMLSYAIEHFSPEERAHFRALRH